MEAWRSGCVVSAIPQKEPEPDQEPDQALTGVALSWKYGQPEPRAQFEDGAGWNRIRTTDVVARVSLSTADGRHRAKRCRPSLGDLGSSELDHGCHTACNPCDRFEPVWHGPAGLRHQVL